VKQNLHHVTTLGNSSPAKPKVLYIDLDLHFADGVCEAFKSMSHSNSGPSQVLTLSIHYCGSGFFPASPLAELPNPLSNMDPYTLSIPLKQGCSGTTLRDVWVHMVEPIKDAFFGHTSLSDTCGGSVGLNSHLPGELQFVVLQCGVDGLAGDPCAIWNLDIER
jgi:histone deacetylase 8